MNLNTKCAVCGSDVESFDICDTCGWQDDGLDNRNPDEAIGPNKMSLNEAKQAYKKQNKAE
jgi:hypothetical protein